MLLPGEVPSKGGESAEAILVDGNEPMNKAEVSQVNEGRT